VEKCRFVGQPANRIPVVQGVPFHTTLYFPVEERGAVFIGNPCGTDEFIRREVVSSKTTKLEELMPSLQALNGWSRWNLLKFSLVSKVGYLARVVEPRNSHDAFRQFDGAVDLAIRDLVGPYLHYPDSLDTVSLLRSAPLRFGGLGIQRYSGLAGELACLLSRKLVFDFLESFIMLIAA
jgi:hypothetical protein